MRPAVLRSGWAVALLAAGVALGACKKNEPAPAPTPPPTQAPPAPAGIRVTEVQLGNALGPDKKVTTPMTTFSPKDTVFASVVTDGAAPSAEVKARWTFSDGQVVNETSRPIASSGVTEFSIQKADGWPPGQYKVEIHLDGKPVESKSFTVQ